MQQRNTDENTSPKTLMKDKKTKSSSAQKRQVMLAKSRISVTDFLFFVLHFQ